MRVAVAGIGSNTGQSCHREAGLRDRGDRLAWRIGLFHPERRAAVGALAVQHRNIADLAESFPALLFALATGYGSTEQRMSALSGVVAGRPLAEIAAGLGLAWWTRKLPAGALKDPLPVFPLDADFSRRMAAYVPATPGQVALWLPIVCEAVPAGGRNYALWIARHGVPLSGTLSDAQRLAFHAWIWMAWHPGTLGHALVRRPWSADLGIKRVLEEFSVFMARAALVDVLGAGHLGGAVAEGVAHGLTFRPLRSVFDYINAAAALDNCLEQYADRLRRGHTAVAAIFSGADMIGCVEVGPHPTEAGVQSIVQLRTYKNRRAPAGVWAAAYTWLATCDLQTRSPRAMAASEAERAQSRALLWGPYLTDLATQPGCDALHATVRDVLLAEPVDFEMTGRRPTVMPRARGPLPVDPEHATLLQRLSRLAGRGVGHPVQM